RRLRRYFQAYTIMVLTGTQIKQALLGPEKTRRVAKWAIKLGKHDIIFLKTGERETPIDFLPEIPFDDSENRVKEKEVSFFTSWLRCIALPQTDKIIKEIHKGSCRFNAEPRSMVAPPSMHREAAKTIQDCDKCKDQSAIRKAWMDKAITIRKHMEIMHYIEKQLVQSQQSWVDNLAKEVWVHRTLSRNNQEETSFSLTYGSEAVVLIVKAIDDGGERKKQPRKARK
nr:retrovirus-related Pol polyprotein from transposon 412 family [Tanacetum cinerariifolium]